LDSFINNEYNYLYHRVHNYNKRLIDFCVNYQPEKLILLNQNEKIGIVEEDEFVFRNWSYYELMTKIKYKAEKARIELLID